jgi:hypothetical protein
MSQRSAEISEPLLHSSSCTYSKGLHTLNLDNILAQLKQERDRIDSALAALGGLSQSTNGLTSRTKLGRRGGGRHMTAAGRKRLSEMMKKRWGEVRGPRQRAKTRKAPRHMSAAARRRIAAAQRARWAKVKGQKKKAA